MINDHDYGTIGQRHTSFVEDSTPAPTALYKVLASSLDTTDSIYVINNPVGSVLKLPCCVRLGTQPVCWTFAFSYISHSLQRYIWDWAFCIEVHCIRLAFCYAAAVHGAIFIARRFKGSEHPPAYVERRCFQR